MKGKHRGRKVLALLLALCIAAAMLPMSASALESYYSGDGYSLYLVQGANYRLSITGDKGWEGWKTTGVSPYLVNSVEIWGQRIKTIPSNALERTSITSLEVPNSVEEIESRAFAGTRLGNVSLPGTLKSIASDAFQSTPNPKITLRINANSNTLLSSASYQYGTMKLDLGATIQAIELSGSGSLTIPAGYSGDLPKLTVKKGATLRIGKWVEEISLTAEDGAKVWNDTAEPITINGIVVPPGVNYGECVRILEQPKDVEMVWDPEEEAVFRVGVSPGATGVSYQWYQKGTFYGDDWALISGETRNEFCRQLDDLALDWRHYTTEYKCVVTQTFQTAGGSQKLVQETTAATLTLTDYVTATGISYTQPETLYAGSSIKLTGSVTPKEATDQEIKWSVEDPGKTGAVVKDNVLTTTNPGTVKLQAKLERAELIKWDNEDPYSKRYSYDPLEKTFTVRVGPAFVPVTSVEEPPEIINNRTRSLELPMQALPTNATNQGVTWRISGASLEDSFGKRASASLKDGNKLTWDYGAKGSIYLYATVQGGAGDGTTVRNYEKTFILLLDGNYPSCSATNHTLTVPEGNDVKSLSAYYLSNASGERDAISYSWQYLGPETGDWQDIPGSKNRSYYSIPAGQYGVDESGKVTAAIEDYRFRCIATYNGLRLPTQYFQFDVSYTNVTGITGHLDSTSEICIKTPTAFGGAVVPSNATANQIEYSIVNGNAAIDDNGILTCTEAGQVTVKMTVPNGVKNSDGTFSDFTKEVTVTANENTPAIETDLPSDVYLREDISLSLDLKVSSPGVSYQWYFSEDGTTWEPLNGSTRSSLLLLHSSEYYQDDWQYRCEVTNGAGTTTSSACTLHTRPKLENFKVEGLPSELAVGKTYTVTTTVEPEDCLLSISQFTENPPSCQPVWRGFYGEEFTCKATDDPNVWEITPLKAKENGLLWMYITQTVGGREFKETHSFYVDVISTAPAGAAITWEGQGSSESTALTLKQYQSKRLSVECTEGGDLHYQWQSQAKDSTEWAPIDGATTRDYVVNAQSLDMDGMKYRCVVTNEVGEATSQAVTLTVEALEYEPQVNITTHPQSIDTVEGNSVFFDIVATGKDLAYQWEQSADGENWTVISDETENWLILETTTAEMNGYQYRCAVTGAAGVVGSSETTTVYSEAATLTVESYTKVEKVEPGFTEFYLYQDNNVSGTIFPESIRDKDILWFLQDDGGTGAELSQENILTAKKEGMVTLLAIVPGGLDGSNNYQQEFQVPVFTNPNCMPPTVYSKEDSKMTLVQGEKTVLAASAMPVGEEELTYQWQSSSNKTNWSAIQDATESYYMTPAAKQGETMYYCCTVSNTYGSDTTGIFTVTGIAATPVANISLSLDALEAGGEPVWLSGYATVKPDNASYQNIHWTIKDAGETGADFDELGCLVAEEAGTVIVTATIPNGRLGTADAIAETPDSADDYTQDFTIPVTKFVATSPEILSQPMDLTVPEGSRAVFMVWAAGTGIEYQWQRRNSEAEDWKDLENGEATAVYEIPKTEKSDNGSQYRCILSNAAPGTVTSDIATLTVTSNSGGSSGGGGGGASEPDPGPEPEPTPGELPFTDVAEGEWFYDSVKYVYENGLFFGTGETEFSPNGKMTRGMAVTVLYRMAGSPAPEGEGSKAFTDVDSKAYYAAAVYWAQANGVMMGTGGDRFSPNDPLTREQLAATLYRFAGSPNTAGTLERFTDADSASQYAKQALCWAVEQGILTGKENNRLDPKGTAKRCEIAAMVTRYLARYPHAET